MMFEVNAEELRECLIEDLKVGLTPMVASSPGMGKSDIIRSIAANFKLKVIDFRVSQCEPVDMQGYPGVVDGRMTFHIPEYFPIETDDIPEGYDGWLLFLDEFNSGNKQTEAAAYKLILDREVYKHKLHHRIISLIKFKPEILHKFDPSTNELTFPCPRTWEFASKVITNKKAIDSITKTRLAGTIGEGATVELATYADIYLNLPTIEEILKNPKSGWKVPKEPSEQYAVTTMLAHNSTRDNIDKIVVAINRLPTEMQIVTFRDIYKRAPKLKGHPIIKEWIASNSSLIF